MDLMHADDMLSVTAIEPACVGDVPALPMRMPRWEAVAAAYLAEVGNRTGSARTPGEYGRYLGRFLAGIGDPIVATPADIHAFAYGPGPSGRMPSPSSVSVRLAALRGFYDFARRMRMLERNPADDVKRPRNADVAIFGVNGWRWEWARDAGELVFALDGDAAGQRMFRELAPAARLRGKAVAYLELEAYGGEKDAAAAWAAGVLDVGEWPAAATLSAPVLRTAEADAPAKTGGDLTKPDIHAPAGAALEGNAGDDDPWADDELMPGDTVATTLPPGGLTCPEARALTDAAYAVDWADELAALTIDELEAYAERMAGCGPIGQAAILEARYRLAKTSS